MAKWGGNFLNPFQSESVSIPLTTLLYPEFISEAFLLGYIHKATIMTVYLELNRLILLKFRKLSRISLEKIVLVNFFFFAPVLCT